MEIITVKHGLYTYGFRPCDTAGRTQEEVQKLADECGRMQYDHHGAWLLIPGVGYGWNVRF